MKPIHLTLSGLQSYREKQEVDFTKLCDAGVFGIFGPTGSGKSTILDAMTLALFGKVERASGGTQGIMNQNEQALSVSFTFELTGAAGSERYKVERQFKRSGEHTVNNTLCRVMRLDEHGGAAVLADKAGDVLAKVLQILGLSMQDFTRAVVLPQGKFAEFLALKGVERRQMLQRLFHLEPYGDMLNAKVSGRCKDADMAVRQLEAEQNGLGDASEAALEEARKRLNEAADAAKSQRAKLMDAEQTALKLRALHTLEQERQALTARQEELAARKPEVEAIQARLREADQASRLQPYLEEWENAVLMESGLLAQAEAVRLSHQECAAASALEDARYEAAKQEWDRESGPLQIRVERLTSAIRLAEDIAKDEARGHAVVAKENGNENERVQSRENLGKEQMLKDKALLLQADLKEKLKLTEVKPERREAVQAALRDKERLETILKQSVEAEAEFAGAERQEAAARRHMEAADELLQESAGQLGRLVEEGWELSGKVAAGEQGLQRLQAAASSIREALVRSAQEAVQRSLAAKLVESLTDGAPCPVCGSTDHPAAAASAGTAGDAHVEHHAEERLQQLDKLVQQLNEHRFRLKQDGFKLEHALEPLIALAPQAGSSAWEQAAPAVEWMPEAASEDADAILQESGLEAAFGTWMESMQSLLTRIPLWERTTKTVLHAHQEQSRKLAEAQALCQAATQQLGSHGHKRTAARTEADRLAALWNSSRPDMPVEAVDRLAAELQQADREAEELKARLAKSDPFIEEQQRKIAECEQHLVRLERSAAELVVERKGILELVQEKRKRLKEQAETEDGGSLEGLLREAVSRLEMLQQAERSLREHAETRRKELLALSNRLAAAGQAAESAQEARTRAAAKWNEAMQASPFRSGDEVRASLLSSAKAADMQEEAARYQDQTSALAVKLEQVLTQLNGQRVTEPEWKESEERYLQEKERNETLLQLFAKAERDAEELEGKHERWCILERRKSELKELLNRLLKLQSVLRGNAFVEFIAEEQLLQVSRAASERLGQLTRRRYALEIDSSGGFVIRDDANGGIRRPVSTLSGGETFLTSLSLSLALSAQIQLNGRYPLEFFFLDEGFGTLDPELLETVVTALEKLHMERLTVGVISHVPELRARLPRRLTVIPAEPSGAGSRIVLDSI